MYLSTKLFDTIFLKYCIELFLVYWNVKLKMLYLSDAFDNQLILKTLQDILEGRVCQIPLYDFKTNSRYVNSLIYKGLWVNKSVN